VWSQENEGDVIAIRDSMVRLGLSIGKDVISSDTNFGRKHPARLEQLAREAGAEFEVKRFDVPLATCLERNLTRTGDAKVPDGAIREMYNKFVMNDPEHYPLSAPADPLVPVKVEHIEGLPSAIICDLDGTLADFKTKGHRGPYDGTKCDEDDLVRVVYELINIYSSLGSNIIYLSGREDCYRPQTDSFLRKYNCPKGQLLMRATGDHRKDAIVKRELFDANVRGRFNVEFVLDDRDQVVKMWRGLGLTCFQVAEGNF
jgi:hypothetical protein